MATIHRDNGTTLGTVTHDGDRVFLVLRAPDGYSGREASWLLSVGEADRLTDAVDKAAVDAACSVGNCQMG